MKPGKADERGGTPLAPIKASVEAYEQWMRSLLGTGLVEADLARKHEKMRESPFVFLRATYWRWAETVLDACPEVASAPAVLAVGDIHVENYGTWRDAEGRLVWGINDFDEAARMPYALDLLRLSTSALLAGQGGASAKEICRTLLEGYVRGLRKPQPIVLERDWQWLRQIVVVSEEARAKFWKKMAASLEPSKGPAIPKPFDEALRAAMPAKDISLTFAQRTAGAGSLGRPRWIAYGEWCGAPIVREAKALLPSAWVHTHGGKEELQCGLASTGPHRAIDPWYRTAGNLIVRRLSPNNRKIDAEKDPRAMLDPRMLDAMGQELANIHAAEAGAAGTILSDLGGRQDNWLGPLTKAAAQQTESDFAAWRAA